MQDFVFIRHDFFESLLDSKVSTLFKFRHNLVNFRSHQFDVFFDQFADGRDIMLVTFDSAGDAR